MKAYLYLFFVPLYTASSHKICSKDKKKKKVVLYLKITLSSELSIIESINVSNTCLLSREDDIKFLGLFVLPTWNEYNYFPILLVNFSNLNLWVEKKWDKMNNFWRGSDLGETENETQITVYL